jgi:thiol-disulfide isomerase/thioredoxin
VELFLRTHIGRTTMNAKGAGTIVLLVGLSLVCVVAGFSLARRPDPGAPPAADGAAPVVAAPELTGVTAWVNSTPFKLADLKGKVVVVHFWTNGCINCVHNYPHYRAWQDRYKDEKGLQIVSVHTPEFEAEKNVDRIKERMAKNKLTFPVAVDNDGATWKAWGNRYWPSIYLVDKTGAVRSRWEGELGDDGYRKVTTQIDELLAEAKKP